MVIIRPLPEFGVEIVCDGETAKVVASGGQVIEERQVEASDWMEVAEAIGDMEVELTEAAAGMEICDASDD